MGSPILNKIGLGNIDILFVVLFLVICIAILFVTVIMQNKRYKELQSRYDKFMQGTRAKSLEKKIMELFEEQGIQKSLLENHSRQLKDLYRRHQTTFQKMGFVKYDAFKEMGGKLSFVLVLLDENNNGFLLNSVHSSDGCYSYTKRIKNGQSDLELSPEEAVALKKAVEE
ncbi:MAG: DUF4446 family protein [Lachnospiraceae bacterium]|nr:DUF4446 family protein [Lachnospiraceae bacterium]